ncbi:MAG: Rne/Rng family ribonuclease, partial [Alphaproteobacteria bacterium]|nr:Rne/Rng family ribonuclease [Alphaproteobacteria bacterium]
MTKRMLIDAAHPEETRVVVVSGNRLEDFDVEVASRRQLKGNIYLAKVTRVEPSLQACFVDYGGNRHGFLAFSEIHPDYYQIPVEDRRALIEADARAAEAQADRAPDTSVSESFPEEPPEDFADAQGDEGAPDSPPDQPQGEAPAENGDAPFGESAPESAPESMIESVEAAPAEYESQPGGDEAYPPGESPTGEETAPAENGGAEAKPTPVEVVGGDSDDDLQMRRPSSSRRHYKIQEVIKRRQIMLVQVVKEERSSKGAALTTYMSLAGRYCVLMPNTARGGGISRKIAGGADRKRLKSVVDELDIPDGMAVIVRTAGAERNKTEITRDYEYLLRAWTDVREKTLESIAPALVYEEGSIIKRAVRDLYSSELDEVIVSGESAYQTAKELMRHLVPSHAKKVKLYKDETVSLLRRYQVEDQLALIHNPRVQLRSGGYIVINPTEALVSIDVNSGRATRERHIEETALRTNLEAAEEIARQLRLRDLAGLIVIDFIDMESSRNQIQVERRLKEAMRHDRARIQIGRISHFGLLEMSRQRLRPSLVETSSVPCPHCDGTGLRRSTDSSALVILRAIEEEGVRQKAD